LTWLLQSAIDEGMPRVIVQTDFGEEIGEIEVFPLSRPTRQSYLGFDGIALTKHWLEAKRQEELAAQKAEWEEVQQ